MTSATHSNLLKAVDAHLEAMRKQELLKKDAAAPVVAVAKASLANSSHPPSQLVLTAASPSPVPQAPTASSSSSSSSSAHAQSKEKFAGDAKATQDKLAAQQSQKKSDQAVVPKKGSAVVVETSKGEALVVSNPLELPSNLGCTHRHEGELLRSAILCTNKGTNNDKKWVPIVIPDKCVFINWKSIILPSERCESYVKEQAAKIASLIITKGLNASLVQKLELLEEIENKCSLQSIVNYYSHDDGIQGVPDRVYSPAWTMVGLTPEDPKEKKAKFYPRMSLNSCCTRYVTVITWDDLTGKGGIKRFTVEPRSPANLFPIQDYSEDRDWEATAIPEELQNEVAQKAKSSQELLNNGIHAAIIVQSHPSDTSADRDRGCKFHFPKIEIKVPDSGVKMRSPGVSGNMGLVKPGEVNKNDWASISKDNAPYKFDFATYYYFQSFVTHDRNFPSADTAAQAHQKVLAECQKMVQAAVARFNTWQ